MWAANGKKGSDPPKPVAETSFLPVRIQRSKAAEDKVRTADRRLQSTMMAMCGF